MMQTELNSRELSLDARPGISNGAIAIRLRELVAREQQPMRSMKDGTKEWSCKEG